MSSHVGDLQKHHRGYSTSRRWSWLLWVTLAGIFFMGISGFVIFFSRGLFDLRQSVGPIHLWGSLCSTVFYLWYQYKHFARIRTFKNSPLYRLGIVTYVAMLLAIVTGAFYWGMPDSSLADLGHILAGFAILVLVSAHVLLAYWVRKPSTIP